VPNPLGVQSYGRNTRCEKNIKMDWGEYLDLSGRKWQEVGEGCIMRSFITCMLHQILLEVIKSRKMRWAGYVGCMGDMRNAYNILVGKPQGKRPLGRPRHR
jgi:hypothetical protein